MNKQEKQFFLALSRDRANIADTLEKPAVRGFQVGVVEKYSDQAHFIYELLQNADDACATHARFVLEDTQLIFAHNGTRHFSVSNPETEEEDTEKKTLGDINAITSIANSNKSDASIGKFGVGFKAVFQYTQTPFIYDPVFRFKIERFIVPILLKEDFPDRNADETLFVFPFNHPKCHADTAREDIFDKLKTLSFPLLFLTNLKKIAFEFHGTQGEYDKTIEDTYVYDTTIAEHLSLTRNDGKQRYTEKLWLFSRLDVNQRRYSVGFFTDDKGHLKPVRKPAFCFFPTKEVTELNVILHAPFLLTDSREGIRAVPYNKDRIYGLAELAADVLEYLKDIGEKTSVRILDDTMLSIIPYDPDKFSNPNDKDKVSFMPFYTAIKEKLKKAELLPSTEGYVSSQNAYWASVPQLPKLFSNVQLAALTGNENACWVFTSRGSEETLRNQSALFTYVRDLVKEQINETALIKGSPYRGIDGITESFIEEQTVAWLHKFYKWLSETRSRTELAKKKPVFLDQDKHAAAAFDEKDQPVLFLPGELPGYKVVHPELLKKQGTRKFIESLGIKQPSLRDEIYTAILPLYKNGIVSDTDTHFKLMYRYYQECPKKEIDEYIRLIKDYEFLTYYINNTHQYYHGCASSMYIPKKELIDYFETNNGIRFIDIDRYRKIIGKNSEENLMSFLYDLGVKEEISIIKKEIDFYSSGRTDLPREYSTHGHSYEEYVIDGCEEIVRYIDANNDQEKSVVLWNSLLRIIKEQQYDEEYFNLEDLLQGTYEYYYYTPHEQSFTSSTVLLLREKAWLMDNEGNFRKPSELYYDTLSEKYDTNSPEVEELLNFLEISAEDTIGIIESEDGEGEGENSSLTEEQRKKIAIANIARKFGIESEEELAEILEKYFRRQKPVPSFPSRPDVDEPETQGGKIKTLSGNTDDAPAAAPLPLTPSGSKKGKTSPKYTPPIEETDDDDNDDFMPPVVDYSKKIKRAEERNNNEIQRIAYFEHLQEKVNMQEKYTAAWFNTLLEMESKSQLDAHVNSREVSISFGRVEREPGTERTLILKYPNRTIPQFMEDISDIPLVLSMGDQTKTLIIEVASIRSYTLRVKLKKGSDVEGIDFSTVNAATIDAKSPAFLLEELKKRFTQLGEDNGWADDFSLKKNLCKNIEFVFGPPGTGKTTHLVRNMLLPWMKQKGKCKVLVLTPTNKAADVLVRRIMELSDNDSSYEGWLVRFGGTGDETIEKSPVLKDKTFDIRTHDKNVTVTTIARFPYDFFMPPGERIYLREMLWDYIVIDEASMIPLANIVFPLFKKIPQQFIIAGDPFQIEPITSVEIWKNENIYTMIGLNSFVNPKTSPHQYNVELLTTQYRSIPTIGEIFSQFAYGGILKHSRSASSQRRIVVGDKLKIDTLNIIKFPVHKYESIYRAKRLQRSSSYQIYSALLTFEFVAFLSRRIADNPLDKPFTIGIIAPYRAQADMIDKLLASEKLPSKVEVQVGTIHGFQGDECDMVFAVFNTPPTISNAPEMFLNKLNIINVSISRARDYLFLVMPDENTEGIENLRLVNQVEDLMQSSGVCKEFASQDLEKLMFNDANYLENNAFSTSHQSVNVYGLPEKRYEVRAEDNAVDVQIHRGIRVVSAAPSASVTQAPTSQQDTATPIQTEGSNVKGLRKPLPTGSPKEECLLQITGAYAGSYALVRYEGRLKKVASNSTEPMYISLLRFGKEKLIFVSVDEKNKTIYIAGKMFDDNRQDLLPSGRFILRKKDF